MDEQVEVSCEEVAADPGSHADLELECAGTGRDTRSAHPLQLTPLLLVLAGCGAGAVAAVNSAQDDGSSDSVGGVSAFEVQGPEQEPATIRFRLTDAEGDAARVSLHYQVPGQPLRMLHALGGMPNPVWLSASSGGSEHELTWTSPGTYEAGTPADNLSDPRNLIARDLDGDGDLDLASANFGSGNITIFFGDHEE